MIHLFTMKQNSNGWSRVPYGLLIHVSPCLYINQPWDVGKWESNQHTNKPQREFTSFHFLKTEFPPTVVCHIVVTDWKVLCWLLKKCAVKVCKWKLKSNFQLISTCQQAKFKISLPLSFLYMHTFFLLRLLYYLPI